MAVYLGLLTVRLHGIGSSLGTRDVIFEGAWGIQLTASYGDPAIAGRAVNAGDLADTLYRNNGEVEATSGFEEFPIYAFTTELAAFGVPLGPLGEHVGINQSLAAQFDALHTTIIGGGTFIANYQGHQVETEYTVDALLFLYSAALIVAADRAEWAEGALGPTNVTFTATRYGDLEAAGSGSWSVVGTGANPARPSDFMGDLMPSGFVEFAPGEFEKTITVPVRGDRIAETDRTFELHIGQASDPLLAAGGVATVRIIDDDPPVRVSIQKLDADRAEGTGAPAGFSEVTPFDFFVARSGNMAGTVVVEYRIDPVGPRGTDRWDFHSPGELQSAVTIHPGSQGTLLRVLVSSDAEAEADESFTVTLLSQSPTLAIDTAAATGVIRNDDAITDLAAGTSSGQALAPAVRQYEGPVAELAKECIILSPDNLVIATTKGGWFIRTGNGDDAVQVPWGPNVLDGGGGSNFLTGGLGADTFFLDARGAAAEIWSTVANLDAGDAVTVWGISDATAALAWEDGAGASGRTGLTLHATRPGQPAASLSLTGYARADMESGRLVLLSGHDAASGADFLHLRLA